MLDVSRLYYPVCCVSVNPQLSWLSDGLWRHVVVQKLNGARFLQRTSTTDKIKKYWRKETYIHIIKISSTRVLTDIMHNENTSEQMYKIAIKN